MNKWLKLLVAVLGLAVIATAAIISWNKWEYGPNPPINHKRINITLPYTINNEATNMIAMGETIAHPIPGGHPGIDFQWDHSVPIIAVVDGKISGIKTADDMGEPVLYLSMKAGEYLITYKELENLAPGIKSGVKVSRGDILGYPHCTNHTDQNGQNNTGCQVHWEFGYATFPPGDRLCPLTYFDTDARGRIEKLWTSIPVDNRFKQNAPDICSNIYKNRDQ